MECVFTSFCDSRTWYTCWYTRLCTSMETLISRNKNILLMVLEYTWMQWIQDPDSSDILSNIEDYLLLRKGLSISISHNESWWEIEKQIWKTCKKKKNLQMSIGEKKTSTWPYLYPARSARNAVNQSEFLRTSWSSAFSKDA